MNAYQEVYRPQFHFSPKENWLNDPNGMVYYEGEYHLFFQYHPHSSVWGPMHWGHAVSKDMIHWEELPIGLFPDEHGTIFSGSAVVDWEDSSGFFNGGHGLVAIFTHHAECLETGKVTQCQSLAYSKDWGRTWTKYAGNPVLADANFSDFRDPKVFWHMRTKKWVMSLACGKVIRFYSSENLKDWDFLSEFGEDTGVQWGVWECPDLFELPIEGTDKSKWVLLVSIGENTDYPEGTRTQYFIGHFDGVTFTNENESKEILWLDHGKDNYAGVSWSDIPKTDGRRIYLAWMSNWRYANMVPTASWRGSMTLPRVLTLIPTPKGTRIKQEVIAEIQGLRQVGTERFKGRLEEKETKRLDLVAATCELEMGFQLDSNGCFQLNFLDETKELVFKLVVDMKSHMMIASRHMSQPFSPSFSAIDRLPMPDFEDELVIKIYIDHSSVEVLAFDGTISLTYLLFPEKKLSHVLLEATYKKVIINHFNQTALMSIWG